MLYGVKILQTIAVGDSPKYFYEEMILTVNAETFEEAYKKAEGYMCDAAYDHINPNNESVRTEKIEMLDCFLAFDPENDVQEIYSAYSINNSSLSEDEFYKTITNTCSEDERRQLRNKEYN